MENLQMELVKEPQRTQRNMSVGEVPKMKSATTRIARRLLVTGGAGFIGSILSTATLTHLIVVVVDALTYAGIKAV